jgi:hypothetical protein
MAMPVNAYLLRTRTKVIAKHPSLALRLYRGEVQVSKEHLRIELREAKALAEACNKERKSLTDTVRIFQKKLCYINGYLYAACRGLNPDVVVETGVRRGVSTAFILQALKDNDKGRLYSIDLPNVIVEGDTSNVLPGELETGGQVPDSLKGERWSLILGDSKVELPKLLSRLGEIDVFHHDSLHTYDHMLFEYREAWKYLRHGGLLLSDDAGCNSAFVDFYSEVGARGVIIGDAGIVSKD